MHVAVRHTLALLLPLAAGAALRAQAPVMPSRPVAPPPTSFPAPAALTVTPSELAPVQPAGALAPAQATMQVQTVATIGSKTVITNEEVWHLVRQRLQDPRATAGLSPDEQKAREHQIFDEQLRMLIERELILDDFIPRIKKNSERSYDELFAAAKREAQKNFDKYKKVASIPDEETMVKMLQAQGINYHLLLRQLTRDVMLRFCLENVLKDQGKTITLKQIETFYAEHPKDFATEDNIAWLDLFVSHARFGYDPAKTKLYAEWLLKQAQDGADFAKLIEQYGHGDSKLRGGAGIGTTPDTIRPVELAQAVAALKPGAPSGLLPTETGIHIVKVTDREYAGVMPYSEKVQEAIRAKITYDLREAERQRLVQSLWRKTNVVVTGKR